MVLYVKKNMSAYQRKLWVRANPELERERRREWYKNNKELNVSITRRWREMSRAYKFMIKMFDQY